MNNYPIFLKEFIKFFKIEEAQEYNTYFVIIASCCIISSIVFLINFCVFFIFERNILEVKITWYNYLLWMLGTTATYILLFLLKISAFNIQSIIAIAFVWDRFFTNIYMAFRKESDAESTLVATSDEL